MKKQWAERLGVDWGGGALENLPSFPVIYKSLALQLPTYNRRALDNGVHVLSEFKLCLST